MLDQLLYFSSLFCRELQTPLDEMFCVLRYFAPALVLEIKGLFNCFLGSLLVFSVNVLQLTRKHKVEEHSQSPDVSRFGGLAVVLEFWRTELNDFVPPLESL